MYICVCNAIRETDLRAAAVPCCGDAETVYRRLGHEPQCRQCLDDAEHILAEERMHRPFVGSHDAGFDGHLTH